MIGRSRAPRRTATARRQRPDPGATRTPPPGRTAGPSRVAARLPCTPPPTDGTAHVRYPRCRAAAPRRPVRSDPRRLRLLRLVVVGGDVVLVGVVLLEHRRHGLDHHDREL